MKRTVTIAAACAALAIASGCEDAPMNPGGGGANPIVISVVDNSFVNGSRTVAVGTQIVWQNNGAAAHTVTSDGGAWAEQTMLSGNSTTPITFNTAGTFPYRCRFHGGMTATITVQ
jgi:plastocyanin